MVQKVGDSEIKFEPNPNFFMKLFENEDLYHLEI